MLYEPALFQPLGELVFRALVTPSPEDLARIFQLRRYVLEKKLTADASWSILAKTALNTGVIPCDDGSVESNAIHVILEDGSGTIRAAARVSIHRDVNSCYFITANKFTHLSLDGPIAVFSRLVIDPAIQGLGISTVFDQILLGITKKEMVKHILCSVEPERMLPLIPYGFRAISPINAIAFPGFPSKLIALAASTDDMTISIPDKNILKNSIFRFSFILLSKFLALVLKNDLEMQQTIERNFHPISENKHVLYCTAQGKLIAFQVADITDTHTNFSEPYFVETRSYNQEQLLAELSKRRELINTGLYGFQYTASKTPPSRSRL